MCTNLFIPSHFWTTYMNFDNCCQRYIAMCGKIFLYRCTSTFSALNYAVEFSSNLSAIYKKSCAQTFRRFFGLFAILTAISRKLYRHLATKMRTVVHLKEQSIVKKALKTASKSTHKPSHNRPTCLNYVTPAHADQA